MSAQTGGRQFDQPDFSDSKPPRPINQGSPAGNPPGGFTGDDITLFTSDEPDATVSSPSVPGGKRPYPDEYITYGPAATGQGIRGTLSVNDHGSASPETSNMQGRDAIKDY